VVCIPQVMVGVVGYFVGLCYLPRPSLSQYHLYPHHVFN
jgi:hypothetical protein